MNLNFTKINYVLLAIISVFLFWTSNNPFWIDEVLSIQNFIDQGPKSILNGAHSNNNHKLFNLLAWVFTVFLSSHEITYRLASIIPALIGVFFMSKWIEKQIGSQEATFFLLLMLSLNEFFFLASQARGFGLTYLGYVLMLLSAIDWIRKKEKKSIILSGFGGFLAVGSFYLTALPVTILFLILTVISKNIQPFRILTFVGLGSIIVHISGVQRIFNQVTSDRRSIDAFPEIGFLDISGYQSLSNFLNFDFGILSVGVTVVLFGLLLMGLFSLWKENEKDIAYLAFFPIVLSFIIFKIGDVNLWARYTTFFIIPVTLIIIKGISKKQFLKFTFPLFVALIFVNGYLIEENRANPINNGRAVASIINDFNPDKVIYTIGLNSDSYYFERGFDFEIIELYQRDADRGSELINSLSETENIICSGERTVLVLRKVRVTDNLITLPDCYDHVIKHDIPHKLGSFEVYELS